MTHSELKEVAEIINKVIERSPQLKGNITVSENDFSYLNGMGSIIYWADDTQRKGNVTNVKFNANDKFKIYFEKVTPSRKEDYGQFYHLLKFEYALSTLQNREIQLSALSYLWDNDPAEQVEFQRRHGFMKNFSDDKVEEEKNKIFIFCFSDSFRNEEAWQLYGNNETGIALGFRFKSFSDDPAYKDIYQFKEVIYDSGYDFDFINEIQFRLFKRFKRRLFLEGITTLSKFYKRSKYKWEREVRLCFDYDLNEIMKGQFSNMGLIVHDKINLEKHFVPQHDTLFDRHFIKVGFDNAFFNLQVSEIICGKNITDEQMEALKIASEKDTKIWRRK